MSKRYARRALALAAVGALASQAFATVVSAQTVVNTQSTVTSSAVAVGPVPSGVAGVNVTVNCQNVIIAGTSTTGSQTYTTATPLTFGSGTAIMNYNLTSAAPGSSCMVTATAAGTANTDKGSISISVGGTSRTVTGNTGTPLTASTAFLPVQISTTVVVTVSYPSVTVKKVVVGDEPVAGFAYPMTIACSNTRTAFVLGNTFNVNGAGTYLSVSGPLTATGGGGLTIPSGSILNIWDSATTTFPTTLPPGTNLGVVNAFLSPDGTLLTIQWGPTVATQTLNFDQASTARIIAAMNAATFNSPVPPNTSLVNGVPVFTGSFTLTGGSGTTATRIFGVNEFPLLTVGSQCEVTENNNQGGVTSYSSTNTTNGVAGTPLPGVQAGTVFKSALTKSGDTITVTNSFYGDLIISKVVTGDPKTNIATFEISVACDKGGPKDTFLLKDRQSKLYNNIATGTNCLVTETRSDGAVASYADNSGDNTTDGRVTIKARGTGCAAPGSPTNSAPGGPAPTVSFNDCMANVIVTNDYNPPATTAAPTTAAAATTAAPATAAPTTAAPAVTAEPAQAVEEEPTFTG